MTCFPPKTIILPGPIGPPGIVNNSSIIPYAADINIPEYTPSFLSISFGNYATDELSIGWKAPRNGTLTKLSLSFTPILGEITVQILVSGVNNTTYSVEYTSAPLTSSPLNATFNIPILANQHIVLLVNPFLNDPGDLITNISAGILFS